MVSGNTAADVAIVFVEELGLEKARKVVDRLIQVKSNKSFRHSIKVVGVLLRLDAKKLLEIAGGQKSKIIMMKKKHERGEKKCIFLEKYLLAKKISKIWLLVKQ
jgi:hypothetical protein